MASVRIVRVIDLARMVNYLFEFRHRLKRLAVYSRTSAALRSQLLHHKLRIVSVYYHLFCADVDRDCAQLSPPAQSRQPAANPVGCGRGDDRTYPIRGAELRV